MFITHIIFSVVIWIYSTLATNVSQTDYIWINHVICVHKHTPYGAHIISPDIALYARIFGPDIIQEATPEHFLLPDLFIWDPVKQYSCNPGECTKCNNPLKTTIYSIYESFPPVQIITRNSPLLLIRCRYRCKCTQHCVDERLRGRHATLCR